jgi:hypothetical protein
LRNPRQHDHSVCSPRFLSILSASELTYDARGPIDTPMLRANEESGAEGTAPDVPLERLGQAQECASVVAFLLSEQAAYVTGAVWSIDGGANA